MSTKFMGASPSFNKKWYASDAMGCRGCVARGSLLRIERISCEDRKLAGHLVDLGAVAYTKEEFVRANYVFCKRRIQFMRIAFDRTKLP